MANPFTVNVPNAFEALMAGEKAYDSASAGVNRRKAADLYRSGNTQGAMAELMAGGNDKTLQALVQSQVAQGGVHGTPIMLQKPDGSFGVGVIGKDGSPRIVDFGQGMSPTVPSKSVDTGTGTYIIPGRVSGGGGQPGVPPPGQASPGGGVADGGPLPVRPVPTQGYYPKDVVGESSDRVYGKEHGEAKSLLSSMRGKLPGLIAVVKQLETIGDAAAYTKAGQLLDYGRSQANLPPRAEAIARTKYIAMVDNQILPLLRETFGAQFTLQEGQSLKTTLGDPEKSPQEKRAVLEAFIEQKVRNIEALELQLRGGGNKNLTGPDRAVTGVSAQTVPSGVVDWRTYFGGK
jgi:hypothetical protein